jgi:hypothetical protein
LQKEEERLRASMRRESKQKRIRERTATGRGLSGSYLEPDRRYEDSEDEGAISLAAIKNKYKRGGANMVHQVKCVGTFQTFSFEFQKSGLRFIRRKKMLRISSPEKPRNWNELKSFTTRMKRKRRLQAVPRLECCLMTATKTVIDKLFAFVRFFMFPISFLNDQTRKADAIEQ